jgi:Cu/Ag efflux protein CusF
MRGVNLLMAVRIVSAFLMLLLLASCSEEKTVPLEVYDIRGEVIRVIAEDQIAVVKHEDIEGWMKAMTMEFPVKDEAELDKLREGAKFEAKVHVQDLDYWLTEIKVIE